MSEAVIAAVEELGMPVVVLDSVLEADEHAVPHDAVVPDYYSSTVLVTRQLLRGQGTAKSPSSAGPWSPGRCRRRCSGRRDARARLPGGAGARLPPVAADMVVESDLTQQGGYDATRALLAARPGTTTGLVCANDALASGAMRALRGLGRRVPEDVSVVGGSDELGEHTFPPLTTYRLDQPALGAIAVQRLARRADRPSAPAVTTILPVDLVRRQSVVPPPTLT